MTILSRVKEMQQKGLGEPEIIQKLKEEGIPANEIDAAIEQSKIKAAVSQEELAQENPLPAEQSPMQAIEPATQETGGMQESVMTGQAPAQTQPVQEPAETTPEYIYPTPQTYSEYQEYQPYSESSAETITEIAEQVAEDKVAQIKKEISNLATLKMTTERKIKDIDERLKRIEQIIDKLQATIIGKIGLYGENIEDIKKEMEMMQDSFSKALPNLFAKKSKIKKKTGKRKSSAIDHYLRR